MFYRMLEASARSDEYPIEEINDHLRGHPERRAAVAASLAYFDPQYHAPRVTAATLLSIGDPQAVGGPEWLAPLRNALGPHAQQYRLTHEGGADAWRSLSSTALSVRPLRVGIGMRRRRRIFL